MSCVSTPCCPTLLSQHILSFIRAFLSYSIDGKVTACEGDDADDRSDVEHSSTSVGSGSASCGSSSCCHVSGRCAEDYDCNACESGNAHLRHDFSRSYDYFCTMYVPSLSIERYVKHIVTYVPCSCEAFIFALAYLQRLHKAGFPLHPRTIHRLFITALVIAIKTHDDQCFSMSFYAKLGGVHTEDLKGMEIQFLANLLDFRTDISVEEYLTVLQPTHKIQ